MASNRSPADSRSRLRRAACTSSPAASAASAWCSPSTWREACNARLVLTGTPRVASRRDQWPASVSASDRERRRQSRRDPGRRDAGAPWRRGDGVARPTSTDEAAMRAVVDQARARFGRIDGVIHAAGIAGGGMIQLKTPEVADAVLAPKVTGRTGARARSCQRSAARFPGAVFVADRRSSAASGRWTTAARTRISMRSRGSTPTRPARSRSRSTGTRGARSAWRSTRRCPTDVARRAEGRDARDGGITNAEGVDAFRRILARRTGTADRDLAGQSGDCSRSGDARQEDRATHRASGRRPAGTERPPPRRSPRPHAADALRRAVDRYGAEDLRDLAGRRSASMRVGIDDNFFDLGGHSLLASRSWPAPTGRSDATFRWRGCTTG